MSRFDLRLYKRLPSAKSLHRIVDQYIIEAEDADQAIALAKQQQIPDFDNSDYAILFGPDAAQLWRIDRDA